MNYLDKLKGYLQARIDFELSGDPALLKPLLQYREFFLDANKPKSFNPFNSENDLVQSDNVFESMCAALEESGVVNPSALTIFEFYSRVKYFDKKSKK
jgi:hypothetical protein